MKPHQVVKLLKLGYRLFEGEAIPKTYWLEGSQLRFKNTNWARDSNYNLEEFANNRPEQTTPTQSPQ